MDITDRAFGHPLDLLLNAVKAAWRIHEIDVPYRARARARAGGRSKVSGSAGGTLRAVRDMAKVAYR